MKITVHYQITNVVKQRRPRTLDFPALPRVGDFFGSDETSAWPILKVWFQEGTRKAAAVHVLVVDDSALERPGAPLR